MIFGTGLFIKPWSSWSRICPAFANIVDLDQLASSEAYWSGSALFLIHLYRHSGSVVELPLCDREVAGSIPGRIIPKTLKMVLISLSLSTQY